MKNIRKEAKEIMETVFGGLIKSEDKEQWKECLSFIDKKIFELEGGDRGLQMFAWREIKKMMNVKFGKKFIK